MIKLLLVISRMMLLVQRSGMLIFYRSVDFLDEIEPGCFRQAQVTFSSRLPHVIPVGDAMSMSPNVITYSSNSPLEILQHSKLSSTSYSSNSPIITFHHY